jgi:hypothetical protein
MASGTPLRLLLCLSLLAPVGCGDAATDGAADDESAATTATDPRPALKTHTFHIAKSVLQPGAFEDQGGALVLRLPYAPVQPVFSDLTTTIHNPRLKTRGEAHLTVLTPAEVQSTGLAMAQLVAIADAAPEIDDLTLACLGVGIPDGKPSLQTFYLVAHSAKVVAVRSAIAAKAHGALDATHYFPHVTVGFTSRDLFPESDHIQNKATTTCPNPTGLVVE